MDSYMSDGIENCEIQLCDQSSRDEKNEKKVEEAKRNICPVIV